MLTVGQPFPEFSLPDQTGRVWTLKDLQGSASIIYFYPKDDTSGCTQEACDFRDALPKLDAVKVIGVSPDSAKSHETFALKYGLPFPLLADTEKELATACGVWVQKSMYGKSYLGIERTTVRLDAKGIIQSIWSKVKVPGHVDSVLAAIAPAQA